MAEPVLQRKQSEYEAVSVRQHKAMLQDGRTLTETGRLADRRDVRPIQLKGAAPVTQRVLDISSSKSNRNPYHELKYADFQSLNKREHLGLTIPSWLWLKRLAQSQYKVTFSTWKEAITAYNEYEKMKVQLSKPQPIKSKVFRFGASVPDPLSMNDAHGIVGMGDSIQARFPVNSSTFVSPGGSADFFGTDMRMRGANVVDIPLSEIKDDNLKDGQRARAVTFIQSCFKGHNIATNIVIFDAISSGSALRLLKELIAEALNISAGRIHLLALNNPPGADGKKFIADGHASHIHATEENRPHANYVKSRIEFQDYKGIGRKYPKNPVGNLTAKTAGQKLAENSGMNAKLMAILFAMHEVAAKDFVEAEDSSDDEE